MPSRPHRVKRTRLDSSSQPVKPHSIRRHRFTRQRFEYCDCGNLAVTVLHVLVGSDPQYTIRMPLCPTCLKIEQDLDQDMERDLHPHLGN
jgi:hypothetical protein